MTDKLTVLHHIYRNPSPAVGMMEITITACYPPVLPRVIRRTVRTRRQHHLTTDEAANDPT